MRRRIRQDGLTVNVVAGSHVVFFGLDLTVPRRKGFRGFAFLRFDAATGETIWLRGMKTFEAVEPHPARGEMFRTIDHPVQSFQWADYSVHPGRAYRYTVVALYGRAGQLERRIEADVEVATEAETGAMHSVFFNRGSVATQEYARRFENQKPSVAGPGAYAWLSRGLVEALLAFLGRATAGWELHGAVYEFQWPAVLDAVRAAAERGAAVRILYDDIEKYKTDRKTGRKSPAGPWAKNRKAIADAGIAHLCQGRGNSSAIMHNKFFVLSEGGVPKAVWTGSTNLTENGIFGHSNVGHIVEDETVARAFVDYWTRLAEDPKVDNGYRAVNSGLSPSPPSPWKKGTLALFSPRGTASSFDALDWYASVAAGARRALLMTFAFGLDTRFKEVYRRDDSVLRMLLLEKAGNNPGTLARDERDVQDIRNRANVVVAMGNHIPTNMFDRWLEEMDRVNPHVHVQWVHTKYMLVDPLGKDPIVVCGSANFSEASNARNDENMLVVRGDRRTADIFVGEYIRLYAHYAFRESVRWFLEKQAAGRVTDWKPQFLVDDDTWMTPYFDPKDRSARYARRRYFAGALAV